MEALDWNTETNPYEVRLRRQAGGPVTTKLILARPRRGPDADIEFFAHWAVEGKDDPVTTWHVLSVTDVALQVTYLPTRHYQQGVYYRDSYIVPDRKDNPRFYDCQLVHRDQPGQVRGYSFVIGPSVHPLDIPAKLKQDHSLLKGVWRLVKGSIREIGLEQHHYLTWQRRQQPNYYLWQEREQQLKAEARLKLTPKQHRQVLELAVAGYVLRCTPQGWELGNLIAVPQQGLDVFHRVLGPLATPAQIITEAAGCRLLATS